MFNIKNILLPTDLSKLSLSAAEYAVDIAIQYDAAIHLLHVLEKTPPILTIRTLEMSQEKIIKLIEEEARKSLENTVGVIRGNKNVKINPVLRRGLDYEEIVEYAKNEKIDLIVIATHGRTGILHTLLGSVAEKVVRYAKAPVLVIAPQNGE